MFIVALLAMTAMMASVVWSIAQQRENERDLVFAGRQFQSAIEHYRTRGSASSAPYPRRLEDLLSDARSPQPQRDLRKIYIDPMTGSREWGLIRLPAGGIVGVYSLSNRAPLQRSLLPGGLSFPDAVSYHDWRFVAPSAAELLAGAGAAPAASSTSASAASASKVGRPDSAPAPVPEATEPNAVDVPVSPQDAVAVRRPTQEDLRTRSPEACDRIAAFDQQTCSDQAARFGEEAGAACQETALKRNLACTLGEEGPLPPLSLRPN